jgi:hypothetical protein
MPPEVLPVAVTAAEVTLALFEELVNTVPVEEACATPV